MSKQKLIIAFALLACGFSGFLSGVGTGKRQADKWYAAHQKVAEKSLDDNLVRIYPQQPGWSQCTCVTGKP